jgi:hypothetical protein
MEICDGDTIIFTDLHPYRLRISGRTTYFFNAFGEELILDNAKRLCRKPVQLLVRLFRNIQPDPFIWNSLERLT